MKEPHAKSHQTAQSDTQPDLSALKLWVRPRLRRMDIGLSEATPGGNAEGDGTS